MTIQTMIDNLMAKNKEGFVDSFLAVMTEKVAEALDVKREEIGATMFQKEGLEGYSKDDLEEGTKAVMRVGFDPANHAERLMKADRFQSNHFDYGVRSAKKRLEKGTFDPQRNLKMGENLSKVGEFRLGDKTKLNAEEHRQVGVHLAKKIEDAIGYKRPTNENFEQSITARQGTTGIKMSARDRAINMPGRLVKGKSYGAQVKTDELGDEVYDEPKAEAPVKRGRGRPSKATEHGGKNFDSSAIADLLKQKMGALPKVKKSTKYKGA